MGPYIVDGHFMYGNTFCMPRPPYYNTICHHRAPALRAFPTRLIADRAGSGVGYSEPEGYDNTDSNGVCSSVVRSSSLPNITAVTAMTKSVLRIKLWGVSEDDDYYVDLEVGNRYAITYLVPGGYAIADGYLEYIDSSISDTCTKYTGNYDEDVIQAYIGLDCSTTGKSDKRKIYISSIRKIEALEADDDYDTTVEDDNDDQTEELLNKIIVMLKRGTIFMTECKDVEEEDDDGVTFDQETGTLYDDETGDEMLIIGGGDKKPHCDCDCKDNDDDAQTFVLVESFLEVLENTLDSLRDIADGMLTFTELNEKKDDGTEKKLVKYSISKQIEKVNTALEELDEDLVIDIESYDFSQVPKSSTAPITKKLAVILRYIKAINEGFEMEESDSTDDEDESE